MLAAIVSALHVLALAVGLPSIWWRGRALDAARARTFCVLNHAEMGIVLLMVFVASFMARGYGMG